MSKNEKVFRKELKFYISYGECAAISNLIRKVISRDKHNKSKSEGYVIRSLYFDTLDNRMYEEKMAGMENRAKYRLRIYGLNPDVVKFEVKTKSNNTISKESVTISREDAEKIQNMDYEVMLKYKNKALNKAYKEFKKEQYYPVVLVEYVREAFICDFNNIRIVFDKFLKSSTLQLDLFSDNIFFTQKLKKGLVVMEIKFDGFLPKWVMDIMNVTAAERSAISKYCIGRIDGFENIY